MNPVVGSGAAVMFVLAALVIGLCVGLAWGHRHGVADERSRLLGRAVRQAWPADSRDLDTARAALTRAHARHADRLAEGAGSPGKGVRPFGRPVGYGPARERRDGRDAHPGGRRAAH